MEEMMNDKWISIEEAAKYLGIKPVTLRGWIRNGKEGLPAHKIGKQWKFKASELDEWVKSGKSAIE
jgi:excisionase family DNA binding protein